MTWPGNFIRSVCDRLHSPGYLVRHLVPPAARSLTTTIFVIGLVVVWFPSTRTFADDLDTIGGGPMTIRRATSGTASFEPSGLLRRPVAAAALGDELWVANSRSGTLSIIDTRKSAVIDELHVAESMSDMWLGPAEHGKLELLILDDSRHALRSWRVVGDHLVERPTILLPRSPIRLALSSDRRCLATSSLWGRKVSLLKRVVAVEEERESAANELSGTDNQAMKGAWSLWATLDLPFSPRELLFHPTSRWLVAADGFAGRLALIDGERACVVRVFELPGQHLHGLANRHDGAAIWVTMQQLNRFRETTHEEVFWGRVLRNVMVELPWDRLLRQPAEPTAAAAWWVEGEYEPLDEDLTIHFLGRPQEGAGDPTKILTLGDETAIITLSGIHEIAFRTRHDAPLEQRRVGRRPVAMVPDIEHRRVYVVNQMDDTVSVLDLSQRRVGETISLGPPTEPTLVDRGEAWFHDATLSLDGWYSCHSCHTDGHSTGLLNDNFGDDSFGAPKRIPSLLGGGATGPWAWHGKVARLEDQIVSSIQETMQGPPLSDAQLEALTAFARQLPPPPTGETLRVLDPALQARGARLFQDRGCVECHAPPTYTSPEAYDVGLEDEVGRARFNPPSLRGVAHRDRLFHDNRASSLRAVFSEHGHPSDEQWDDDEVAALVEFLHGL